jgi:hypothetical protein
MTQLIDEPNFGIPGQTLRQAYTAGDDFYAMLVAAHEGLSDAQSELLNARLVIVLANHVGDLSVLQAAVRAARRGVAPAPSQELPPAPDP